jgi:colanic acid biosynthesis glycosyl transferase WcaI
LGAKLAFSVRGNREAELRKAVSDRDLGVLFVPFASEDKLAARLACADVHVVSLRPDWTGMVVPSKFFGALSAGRPVLFSGSRESSIARWIDTHQVGCTLNSDNIMDTVVDLSRYAASPEEQAAMREKCFRVCQQHFSKRTQMEDWHSLLRSLLMG